MTPEQAKEGYVKKEAPSRAAVPKPSSSVILISPTNTILLLHRVRTSSSFPSAHVFPGGNVDPQDGPVPSETAPDRHVDGPVYRNAAIRETFEESGILLARRKSGARDLLEVDEAEREQARLDVHEGKTKFREYLEGKDAVADTDALIPFTRWITPPNVPKRFTTQMYLYFLPLDSSTSAPGSASTALPASSATIQIPTPTHDGGKEHTAATFLPASKWIEKAQKNEIILFPPQFYILHLISQHLDVTKSSSPSSRRESLLNFINDPATHPTWADRVISPMGMGMTSEATQRSILSLKKPGPELKGSDRAGDSDRVVLVKFGKAGPRDVEVRWRDEMNEKLKGKL